MDRRRFLQAGSLSAASALAGTRLPSGPLPPGALPAAASDMDQYLARVDAGMERLSSWAALDGLDLSPDRRALLDHVAQPALQSMYLTGMVGDLPLEKQVHPGVQQRITRHMDLMDMASTRMSSYLAERSPAEMEAVQQALREHDAGPRVLAILDAEAEVLGVSTARRAHMHALYASVEWRLRNQPPALLVTEYLRKVERVAESDVRSQAASQELAARVAEEAFWLARPAADARSSRISRGARTMGYGLVVLAGSGAIVAAGGFPAVFGMTVGVIMILIGLIILLVGVSTPSSLQPDSTHASGSP